MKQKENILSKDEESFLTKFNDEKLKYPTKNKGKDVIVFNIKPYWCIENKLLLISLIFHPLNLYYKNYKEDAQRFSHKELIENIIKHELSDNVETFLNTNELDKLIRFFRENYK